MYRDVFILVPSNSDYGQQRQSIKRLGKRPQSAKNRRDKSYAVSRLHQNFNSLRVSKIPFKEQTTRQSKSKHIINKNVASKEKDFNNGIGKDDGGSWYPGKARVDHVRGFYGKTRAVNTNMKQTKNSLSTTFFNNVSSPHYVNQHRNPKKKTRWPKGCADDIYDNNVNEKTLRYTSSAFPLRRIKRVYLHRKGSQSNKGANYRDDVDLERVLRVGNYDPYVPKSFLSSSMTRTRSTPLLSSSPGLVTVAQCEQNQSTSSKLFRRRPESARVLSVNIRVPLEMKSPDLSITDNSELQRMDGDDINEARNNDVHGWADDKHIEDAMLSSPTIPTRNDDNALSASNTSRKQRRRPKSAGYTRSRRKDTRKSYGSRPKSARLLRKKKKTPRIY